MSIRSLLLIVFLSGVLWCVADSSATNYLGIRGFSLFHAANYPVGHGNKPEFSGYFGGPLDGFYGRVGIDRRGFRNSSECMAEATPRTVVFIGDSTTAGFEVADDATFVSLINASCARHGLRGINAGVRAFDTHQALLRYLQISGSVQHDYVFYLLSPNDVSENLQEYHYRNVVLKFGRGRIDETGKVIYTPPSPDRLTHAYHDFRIFISDNFYFTSRAVQQFQQARGKADDAIAAGEWERQERKLLELLQLATDAASRVGAKLVVAPYPCLNDGAELCSRIAALEALLIAQAGRIGFRTIPLDDLTRRASVATGTRLEDLRFPADSHLSAKGHALMHTLIVRELSAPLR